MTRQSCSIKKKNNRIVYCFETFSSLDMLKVVYCISLVMHIIDGTRLFHFLPKIPILRNASTNAQIIRKRDLNVG